MFATTHSFTKLSLLRVLLFQTTQSFHIIPNFCWIHEQNSFYHLGKEIIRPSHLLKDSSYCECLLVELLLGLVCGLANRIQQFYFLKLLDFLARATLFHLTLPSPTYFMF